MPQTSDFLIFQVDKFDMRMEVIKKKINPEDVLKMSSGDQYKLVSIINHIGHNLNSGHYITFVKKDENWRTYNDLQSNSTSKDKLIRLWKWTHP